MKNTDEILKQLKRIVYELEDQQKKDKEFIKQEKGKNHANKEAIERAQLQINDCEWVAAELFDIVKIYSCVGN